jgi:hypothetical protein
MLADWLEDMRLVPAGGPCSIDRMIGYYHPYATSHDDFDADEAVQEEVRVTARTLGAQLLRRSASQTQAESIQEPRPK